MLKKFSKKKAKSGLQVLVEGVVKKGLRKFDLIF
jgi:hypothetical protein